MFQLFVHLLLVLSQHNAIIRLVDKIFATRLLGLMELAINIFVTTIRVDGVGD